MRASEPAGEILSGAKDLVADKSPRNLVEAVGVEPTSENSDSRETTCVFRSCCGNYPATFAGCANERTRNANS